MRQKPKFIVRCSRIGKIMTNAQTKSPLSKYNESLYKLEEYKAKLLITKETLKSYQTLSENIQKLEEEIKVLESLKNNPHLSQTCITEVGNWMKEQLYGNYHTFSSKYTQKGIMCEDDAIQFASKYYGWKAAAKNTERKTNEFITGECDVVLTESIVDIKNCWNERTFPLLDKDIPIDGYGWQGAGYMELWGKPKFQLTYCLMDAPDIFVDQEANKKRYDLGLDEVDFELWEEVKKKMTFSHLHDDLRIKSFFTHSDKNIVDMIYSRIEEVRRYIDGSGFYELWERTRLV